MSAFPLHAVRLGDGWALLTVVVYVGDAVALKVEE